jgi:hypothetical protein
MPKSGQFGAPEARQAFALERRGEAPRGAASKVSLPTAGNMGAGGGTGGGSSSSSSPARSSGPSDAGYTSSNPDYSARTLLLRPVTPQRLAVRMRGLSAVRSAVRRVQPRALGVSQKPPRTPPTRNPGARG